MVLLPISILSGFHSCSSYIEAGTHLTPYSVSVSGYYRKDGTYVGPYNRRPPGSVNKDAPWKRQRFLMGTLFICSMLIGLGSLSYTFWSSAKTISEKQSRIRDIKKKRESIHKHIYGNLLSTNIFQSIDIDSLPEYPQNLLHDDLFICSYKHNELPKTQFYVKYKAIKHTYRVCLERVSELSSIGRGHPRSNFLNEINYFMRYKELMIEFKENFKANSNNSPYYFSSIEIEEYFYKIYRLKDIKGN